VPSSERGTAIEATDQLRTEVPFLDLQAQYASVRTEIIDAITAVADSTRYALGPEVTDFEERFAAYVGTDHCVAVNSGTSALHLALITAGVGHGDEVITVPMTFIATTWAISYVGATPVFVDVEPATLTMDTEQVEARITARTKAILPVHLYGQPADLSPLLDIGRRYDIPVIEDAAQAHGARYRDQPAGSLGLLGCFSFYPGKNLGAAGEGGAVVTNDDGIAERVRALRDHAQSTRYHHDELGFNYRMDAIQGAVLGVKLRHLDSWIAARRANAARYSELLDGLPIQLPVERSDRTHVWHLYVVIHPERDRLQAELDDRGISTGLHYPIPVHLQRAYAHLGHRSGEFPVAERVAAECLSLPMYSELTPTQQIAVAAALTDAVSRVTSQAENVPHSAGTVADAL
jgi:dTDP-4-amino-4,6-dideoxygalactose transaminase